MNTIIIFAKYPEPGKVKTRLGEKIGQGLACEFYKIFLNLTFDLVKSVGFDLLSVYFTPAKKRNEFKKIIPPGFNLEPQFGIDLGAKLNHAFVDAFKNGAAKVIIIGSDSPTLPGAFLKKAVEALDDHDLILGPAEDGGYYLIGLRKANEFLFNEIDWSTSAVLSQTLAMADENNMKYFLLPEWYDIDDLDALAKAKHHDHTGLIVRLIANYPDFFPIA